MTVGGVTATVAAGAVGLVDSEKLNAESTIVHDRVAPTMGQANPVSVAEFDQDKIEPLVEEITPESIVDKDPIVNVEPSANIEPSTNIEPSADVEQSIENVGIVDQHQERPVRSVPTMHEELIDNPENIESLGKNVSDQSELRKNGSKSEVTGDLDEVLETQSHEEALLAEDGQQDLLAQTSFLDQSEQNTEFAENSQESTQSINNSPESNAQEKFDRSEVRATQATDVGDSLKADVEPKLNVAEPQAQDTLGTTIEKPKAKVFKADANAIEIVSKIYGDESIVRDKVLSTYRKFDYLFTRHLGIFGKNTLTQVWEDIEQAGQDDQFTEIAISLQLADKTGAMTRKESNTFSTLALQMADELNKKMEFSMDLDESVDRGRMLDELARQYDAMVVCNIIPKRRKGFRSTDVKSCTKDLKMLPANNGVFGRFAKIDGSNTLRYSLALADKNGDFISTSTRDPFQVEEIVLFMNVPVVSSPVEAFELMIQDARKLGAWMDGKLVDKNANNMTTKTLEKIIEQIAMIEKEMRLDGLIPGSGICKKLF